MGSNRLKRSIRSLQMMHIRDMAKTYHTWQQVDIEKNYKDIPEFCYSASLDEIRYKRLFIVPSKYIEFINRDENIDFDEKMTSLQSEIYSFLKEEESIEKGLLKVFKELGYEIKL